MRVLVIGGAGYIGSIVASQLLDEGHEVVVLDNLSQGHRAAVHPDTELREVDILDVPALNEAAGDGFDAAMHFAALALVSESVAHPERYWRTNVCGSLNVLDALRAGGVPRLVFSSTCATYGLPESVPMDESTPTAPVNPYGATKLTVDRMIGDYCAAHGLAAVSLRYFNVAGARGPFGEDHDPETHLIPNLLRAATGQLERFEIYGTDYPTPDGTAIRDYIHVEDLGAAHILALGHGAGGAHDIFNLGNGNGFSVQEVLDVARDVTGADIPAVEQPRRPGDPPALVGAAGKARSVLGWEPQKPGLETMVADAWAWHLAHPQGYEE